MEVIRIQGSFYSKSNSLQDIEFIINWSDQLLRSNLHLITRIG